MGICQGLASNNSAKLYAAWKEETGDDRLFYSVFNGTHWGTQKAMPGNSSAGPSLAFLNGTLYAAWKGIYGDNRLFSAEFDGTNWVHGKTIAGNSDIGPTLASWNGKLYAAWKGEADLRLFYAEFDGHKWLPQVQMTNRGDSTNFTSCVGPSLALFNGVLYAAWRGGIHDQAVYYSSFDGSNWSAPIKMPSTVSSSTGPSLAQFGSNLYVIWKGGGSDERVFCGFFDAAMQWQGGGQITGIPFESSIGAAISIFGAKLYAIWKGPDTNQQISCASFDGSSWTAQPTVPGNTGQDMAPRPSNGLGSNSNYFLGTQGCQPITELSVILTVTQEIASSAGFTLQLNCNAGPNEKSKWQQYILGYPAPLSSLQFSWQVDNWVTVPAQELINSGIPSFGSLPSPIVPVGTHFGISLVFDSNTEKVIGANFIAIPPGGEGTVLPVKLSDLLTDAPPGSPQGTKGPKAKLDDMSPIVGFQVNFVSTEGASSSLSSGAGKIKYSASPALTAFAECPGCAYFAYTLETINSVYGELPLGSSSSFDQDFSAAAT